MIDAWQRRMEQLMSSSLVDGQALHATIQPNMRLILNKYQEHRAALANPSSTSATVAAPPRSCGMRKRVDPLDAKVAKSPPVHWSARALSSMTPEAWEALRQEWGIDVVAPSFKSIDGGLHGLKSRSIPPARCWDELPIRSPLLLAYLNAHFAFPSPIQAQTLPISLTSQLNGAPVTLDVLGVAETGSGKTLCYIIPALDHILADETPLTRSRIELGPLALMVVPTRELAEQVTTQLNKIVAFANQHPDLNNLNTSCCKLSELRVLKVVGGELRDAQDLALEKGAHVLVGTPGQLHMLLEERRLSLGNTRFVAVDEADRMVEDQMSDDLCAALSHCPAPRQTIMFTATMLQECERIALKYLSPRGYFVVRTPYTFHSVWQMFECFPVASVTNRTEETVPTSKITRLAQWLAINRGLSIVFANKKSECDDIVFQLKKMEQRRNSGYQEVNGDASICDQRCIEWLKSTGACTFQSSQNSDALSRIGVIHADMKQKERTDMVSKFQSGIIRTIVTTDLLARGLDVSGLTLVVNLSLPQPRYASNLERSLMQYIHRIGRTGRSGNRGVVVSFVEICESDVVQSSSQQTIRDEREKVLVKMLKDGVDEGPVKVDEMEEMNIEPSRRRARDEVDEAREDQANAAFDKEILGPLYRFLKDCALHSRSVTEDSSFFRLCAENSVDRITIPKPLLLVMEAESKVASK